MSIILSITNNCPESLACARRIFPNKDWAAVLRQFEKKRLVYDITKEAIISGHVSIFLWMMESRVHNNPGVKYVRQLCTLVCKHNRETMSKEIEKFFTCNKGVPLSCFAIACEQQNLYMMKWVFKHCLEYPDGKRYASFLCESLWSLCGKESVNMEIVKWVYDKIRHRYDYKNLMKKILFITHKTKNKELQEWSKSLVINEINFYKDLLFTCITELIPT